MGAFNPLPDFYHVLRNAHNASDEVDEFDVRSEVPESETEFERLCAVSDKASLDLVNYVLENGTALIARLSKTNR